MNRRFELDRKPEKTLTIAQIRMLIMNIRLLPRRDHVRPALKELHWLPVVFRIKFKVALMMFTVHTRRCPDYLTDSVQACNIDP